MVTRAAPAPHLGPKKQKPAPSPRPTAASAGTPLMKQYLAIKEEHPREVLFFRMGDFYEMFYEDAELVSRVLGIALTSRASGAEAYAMAGFPHHALDRYLPRMIAAGFRVAICEQVEDPASVRGKRIVKREVIEVVTPGTLTDERLLEARAANYLLAVHRPARSKSIGLAWFEASSGRFLVASVPVERLETELTRIGPAEIVIGDGLLRRSDDAEAHPKAAKLVRLLERHAPVAGCPDWVLRLEGAREALATRFGVKTLAGLGLSNSAAYVPAAHMALQYVSDMKPGFVERLDKFGRGIELFVPDDHLSLDPATTRCLEIVRPLRAAPQHESRDVTLLGAIDRSATAMGGRLLREWLQAPLRNIAAIGRRQDAVAALLAHPAELGALRTALGRVYDLERLAGRAASGRASARDLAALRDSLSELPAVQASARAAGVEGAELLREVADALDTLAPVHARLAAALEERPAASVAEGRVIQAGHDAELDALRAATSDVAALLRAFQLREQEATGIPSLKIGYNKVFGYYLEVTQAHRNKVPERYVRKQTLKHVERFLTPELKELEEEILTAKDRSELLEGRLLAELREEVGEAAPSVLVSAGAAAQLDVLASLALLAQEQGYVRPELVDDGSLHIVGGRHPVLDLRDEAFVPNDVSLGEEAGRLHLITGPNMAGKSTYIRQTALLVLLGQVGSFLPCVEARIGVVDRIFARVGAGDELAQGLSTFMVEMTETANILRNATDRSLVILDEVGRGTSTFDGVSLAWAIACHLHDRIEARTLFATHYHELTGLTAIKSGVRNRNVAIEEGPDGIAFLHQIVPGSCDRSYGIHVARLAGLPPTVLRQAEVILRSLEQGSFDPHTEQREPAGESQLALFQEAVPREDPLRARLRDLDIDGTTPLEALLLLKELKEL